MYKDVVKEFPYVSGLHFSNGQGYYLKDPESRDYRYVKSHYVPTWILLGHFRGDLTVALPKHPHSKNVIIDIDQRCQLPKIKTQEIVKLVKHYLGEPFYMEHSQETNGFHLYYQFKEYVSDNALQFLEEFFEEIFHYKIEPVIGRSVIRLPQSKTYKTEGFSVEDLVSAFSHIEPLPMPQIFFGHNVWGSIVNRDNSYKDKTKLERDYSYGAGERITAQIEIAFDTIYRGGDQYDYIEMCERFDCGSKDMQLPHEQRDACILKIFTWAEDNFQPNAIGRSQYELLNQEPEDDTEDRYYYQNRFRMAKDIREALEGVITYYAHTKTSRTRSLSRFIEDSCTVFTQIHNKVLYDQKRGDKYVKDNLLTLNEGCLFPKKVRALMAKEFGIQNIDAIIKFLLEIGILNLLLSKDGYAKSYRGKTRWGHHYNTNTTLLLLLYKYIISYYNSSYTPSKEYKLYSDVGFDGLSEKVGDLFKSRPPPGLEGMFLKDRLRLIDKKLKSHYNATEEVFVEHKQS